MTGLHLWLANDMSESTLWCTNVAIWFFDFNQFINEFKLFSCFGASKWSNTIEEHRLVHQLHNNLYWKRHCSTFTKCVYLLMAHRFRTNKMNWEWTEKPEKRIAHNTENFKRFNNWSSVSFNYQFENVWYDIRLYGLR